MAQMIARTKKFCSRGQNILSDTLSTFAHVLSNQVENRCASHSNFRYRMRHPFPCFSTSVALRLRRQHAVIKENVPVCVLDDRGTVKPESGSRVEDIRSPFYTILPAGLPKEERPPPPPVHWGVPKIGFLIEHWLGLGTSASRAKKFGGIFKTGIMLNPVHIVTNMQAIEDIQKDAEIFRSRGEENFMEAFFGSDALTLLDGIDHDMVRNTVAPAFSPPLFRFYFERIRSKVHKTWAAVERDVARNGQVRLDPVFRKHYLSIVNEITTGIDMDSEMASFLEKRFFTLASGFFTPRIGPVWENSMKAKEEIIEVLEDIFQRNLSENKRIIEKLREYGDDLTYLGTKDIRKGRVNVLLIAMANSDLKTGKGEENRRKVIEKLTSLMILLWFAGYATSAATSSCAAFDMGMDSTIWEALQAEQSQIVAAAGFKDVTYDQVTSKMPLLDSFISEMLRMHPAVQGVARVAAKDLSLLGHFVEAGDRLFLDFAGAMRDPCMYPDPDTLVIDRFMRKPGHPSPPGVLSFGAPGSPHYCLGAALAKVLMKTTFSVLLREYRIELDPNQSKKYALMPDESPISKVVVQKIKKRQ